MIVVDASVAIAVILNEENSDEACALLTSTELLHAPSLLMYEFTNAITSDHRNGRMDEAASRGAVEQFKHLPWSFETHAGALRMDAILTLANRHRLSAYDASYLELAVRCNCPIASYDIELRNAAKKEGVHVILKDRKPPKRM